MTILKIKNKFISSEIDDIEDQNYYQQKITHSIIN